MNKKLRDGISRTIFNTKYEDGGSVVSKPVLGKELDDKVKRLATAICEYVEEEIVEAYDKGFHKGLNRFGV